MGSNSRMDINSLLSPQDSPVQGQPSSPLKPGAYPSASPNGTVKSSRYVGDQSVTFAPAQNSSSSGAKKGKKDQLLHQAIASPLNLPTPSISQLSPSTQPTGSYPSAPQYNSPTSSRSHKSSVNSPTTDVPQPRPAPAPLQQRQPSSSSSLLDTLADLASMQQHNRQNSREASRSLRSTELREQAHASPQISPAILSRMRTSSIVSTLSDHGMTDTTTSILAPRRFSSKSLESGELEQLTTLTKQLSDNPYDYNAHVRLLTLLHRGFTNYVSVAAESERPGKLQDYDLLLDMRQAREAMSARFPVGETLWLEWLHDEAILASSPDQQTNVIEFCKKAVGEEFGSSQLWRFYGDWMFLLYKTYHDIDWTYKDNTFLEGAVGRTIQNVHLSEEDRLVGREVFNLDSMLRIWHQGARACQWHIGDSHLVWLPYLEIETYTLSLSPSPGKVHHVGGILTERLRLPQAAWEQTFEIFSNFVSQYDNRRYEERMVSVNSQAAKAKNEWRAREHFEARLHNAQLKQDHTDEWNTMSEYLEFEANQSGRKSAPPFGLDLQLGLCERANLRFPADAEFWEDHVDVIFDRKAPTPSPSSSSSVLTRATKHCPWSGSLWTKRILALEAAQEEFQVLEDVKHLATSSGLLEGVGGMDELIKVYVAWCGFLRRRAFKPEAGEDEIDIAEVGIRSAMDSIKEVGEKKFGKEFKSDPLFRVERIYFKFLAQTGGIEDGRKFWHQLTLTHGDSYDFWERYYLWEMTLWGRELGGRPSSESSPVHATACLQRAIRRPNLDWPERMIDLYLHHCSQHESVQKIQEAQVECRKANKLVAKKRSKEAAEAASHAANQQQFAMQSQDADMEDASNSKRKRESGINAESPSKKARQQSISDKNDTLQDSEVNDALPKRDRENTTIVVRNLPNDATESRVQHFFKDCGDIISFAMLTEQDGGNTATIEFGSKEDVLSALTRDMKLFNGQQIQVTAGTGTTLWVTNYPPEADEEYLWQMFSPYGDVVEVRFPSLKVNTHRRFCYVQFLNANQAMAATELNGKALGGPFKLNVKISDPNIRHDRSGAMEEGREIFVGQLDYSAIEAEVKELFSKFGDVQSVRIAKNMKGQSKGSAFIRFGTKEGAEEALSMNLKPFRERLLKVSLATSNRGKNKVSTFIKQHSGSENADSSMDTTADSDPVSNAVVTGSSEADYRDRTITLHNIPDTVNNARIKALCEKYGEVKKLTLRPERGGALVEFSSVADVGKATMGINGYEITPGQKIQVGEYQEAFGVRNHGTSRAGKDAGAGTSKIGHLKKPLGSKRLPVAPISRPQQPVSKKRSGLGFMRPVQADSAKSQENSNPAKSQDQFRAMVGGTAETNGVNEDAE